MKPRSVHDSEIATAPGAGSPGAAEVVVPRRRACEEQPLDTRLEHVARRLIAEYPGHDPAAIRQLVTATSARLLARSKLVAFIPLFTERHVRDWLDEHPADAPETIAS